MIDFDTAYARLALSEGNFSKDPADPGNWTSGRPGVGLLKGTKYGISAMTYPHLDIEHLTPEEVKALYRHDWWDALSPESLPPALIFQMWDMAVNTGMDAAKRALQRAVRVSDDGVMGNVTVHAVVAMDLNDVLPRFLAQRLRYYTSRAGWKLYGAGWTNRVADRLDNVATDN